MNERMPQSELTFTFTFLSSPTSMTFFLAVVIAIIRFDERTKCLDLLRIELRIRVWTGPELYHSWVISAL